MLQTSPNICTPHTLPDTYFPHFHQFELMTEDPNIQNPQPMSADFKHTLRVVSSSKVFISIL